MGHNLNLLGSCDVTDHVTIRLTMGHFLWMVHCDHASILNHYIRHGASNVGHRWMDGRTHGHKGDFI